MNRTIYILIFLFSFLFPYKAFYRDSKAALIVWNVRQGQMITYSDSMQCIHFDMGGESFPVKKLVQECGQKSNKVFFSHWDWDHINFTKLAWKRLHHFCRLNWPGGVGTKKKKSFLSVLPKCKTIPTSVFYEITFPAHLNSSKRASENNKYSRVVVIKNQVLIPGDSPGSSEYLWQNKVPPSVQILILSHHGSRYSTYHPLLYALPKLKIAIASARKKRYGHPHYLVKQRLMRHKVSMLSTEEFNHIYIPLHK